MDDVQGRVTIAPAVLSAIVRQVALDQRGVSRLAEAGPRVRGLLRGADHDEGIFVAVDDEGVKVELHIVATAATNLLKLGEALQHNVTRAIEEMVGLPVSAVSVYIENVDLGQATPADRLG
jgi:uncharacterized alkaline shock family protein YloU